MNDTLVYFNGDSFFAGDELADELMPGWPGLHDNTDLSRIESNRERRRNVWAKMTPAEHEQIRMLERARSFPGKVEGMVSTADVISNAKGGSSMSRIIRTSIIDLLAYKERYSNITAFIGNTGINRFSMGTHYAKNQFECFSTHDIDSRTPIRAVVRYKVLYETDYHNLMQYYLQVIQLTDFCKANNITLYWVDVYFLDPAIEENILAEFPELVSLKKYANQEYCFSMQKMVMKDPTKGFCPCGHFAERIHTDAANLIVNEILKK